VLYEQQRAAGRLQSLHAGRSQRFRSNEDGERHLDLISTLRYRYLRLHCDRHEG
jgi:hypothetical protein